MPTGKLRTLAVTTGRSEHVSTRPKPLNVSIVNSIAVITNDEEATIHLSGELAPCVAVSPAIPAPINDTI